MEVSVAHAVIINSEFVWTPNLCQEEKMTERLKNQESYKADGYSASSETSAKGKGYMNHGMDFHIWGER